MQAGLLGVHVLQLACALQHACARVWARTCACECASTRVARGVQLEMGMLRVHKARGSGGGMEQEVSSLPFSSRQRFPAHRLGKPGPSKAAIMSQVSLKAAWHKGLSPAG